MRKRRRDVGTMETRHMSFVKRMTGKQKTYQDMDTPCLTLYSDWHLIYCQVGPMEMARQSLCFPAWPFDGVCIRGRKSWKNSQVFIACLETHVWQVGTFLCDESPSSDSGSSMDVTWRVKAIDSRSFDAFWNPLFLTSVLGCFGH